MSLTISEVTRDHLLSLAFNLSDADAREVFLATGDVPELVLLESVWISKWSRMAVDDEGDCVAIFGCAEQDGIVVPWMLTSRKFLKHRREIARRSRDIFRSFFPEDVPMMNLVHADHHEAIRWLSWIGFDVQEQVTPAGPFNSSFRIFTRCVNRRPS